MSTDRSQTTTAYRGFYCHVCRDEKPKQEIERLRELSTDQNPTTDQCDGNRPLPFARDQLGRFVREAWVRWAETQPNPKSAWLVPFDELSEADKEADRQIGEAVARWTLIGDAARASICQERPDAWCQGQPDA